jgi:hypothetical protein
MKVKRGGAPPGSRAGGPREAAHHTLGKATFTRFQEKLKWKRDLEWALDAVLELQSGDLGLVARNLTESATVMLTIAAEIRRELRQ